MPVRFRDLSVSEYFNLSWPFLGIFVLGVGLRISTHWFQSWPFHGDTIALADALMIAGIVGLTFELFAIRFLIQRVADDLSDKIVGHGLPTELQGLITKIVKTDIVRDHYVKTYHFPESLEERLEIEVEVSFEVKNYSHAAISYTPQMDEEQCFQPEFLLLEYGIQGQPLHSLGLEKLKESEKGKYGSSQTTRLVKGDVELTLEPIRYDSSAVCNVRWRYKVKMPSEFSDTTEFRNATLGATIRLEQLVPGLEFECAEDKGIHHEPNSLSWVFDGPFIAGQQIRTRWFRTSD